MIDPTTTRHEPPERARHAPGPRGAVLLEVLLSLSLFVMAAGVVIGGITKSIRATARLRLQAQAADLAVTMFSRIHMGQVPAESDGPNAYPDKFFDEWEKDLADWDWQIVSTEPEGFAVERPRLNTVEVVITHRPTGYAYRLVGLQPQTTGNEALARGPARERGRTP